MDAASFLNPEDTELFIVDHARYTSDGRVVYVFSNLNSWRALGKKIGEHKKLEELRFGRFRATAESLEALLRGISQNKSVRELTFSDCGGNWPLEILAPFYKNLLDLTVHKCDLSHGAIRSLSAALRGCTDCSLETIEWSNSTMDNASAVEFIQSLSGLSRLNYLKLVNCDIGPRGCEAMAALLRNPDCALEVVKISVKSIGDEGLDALVFGLGGNRTLKELGLVDIGDITTAAWQSFADLFSTPTCMLEWLSLLGNFIDSDAMVALADASRGNSRLKWLRLGKRSISRIGWARVFGGEQMNRNISPHVLAWLGGDGLRKIRKCDFTAVYGFLRKMPTLFGNSCRVVRRSMRKRKAQS